MRIVNNTSIKWRPIKRWQDDQVNYSWQGLHKRTWSSANYSRTLTFWAVLEVHNTKPLTTNWSLRWKFEGSLSQMDTEVELPCRGVSGWNDGVKCSHSSQIAQSPLDSAVTRPTSMKRKHIPHGRQFLSHKYIKCSWNCVVSTTEQENCKP